MAVHIRWVRKMLVTVFVVAVASATLAGCNGGSPTQEAGKNDTPEVQKQRKEKTGDK